MHSHQSYVYKVLHEASQFFNKTLYCFSQLGLPKLKYSNSKHTIENENQAQSFVHIKDSILAKINVSRKLLKRSFLALGLCTLITKYAAAEEFSYIIMSDPQLYWSCDHSNPVCDLTSEKDDGIKSNQAVVDKIKQIHQHDPIDAVIINGDLTAFGHEQEFEAYQSFYKPEILGFKVYPGLGNHDYQNNINDCYTNNCARRMLDFMSSFIATKMAPYNINGFDYSHSGTYYKFPESRRDHHGSLSYSWSHKGWRFIQLHNHPEYTTNFNGWVFESARRDFYDISTPYDWLHEQLRDAKKRSEKVVINMHDFYSAISKKDNMFYRLLSLFPVEAIFAGHLHWISGPLTSLSYKSGRKIPVYLSGSPAYGTFLKVDFSDDQLFVSKMLSYE